MKIVINACHGGFGLSHKAVMRYFEIKGQVVYPEKIKPYTVGSFALDQDGADADESIFSYWKYWTSESADREQADSILEYDILRNDSALVQVVEELGESANGQYSKLKVIEVPDDVEWEIDEYDGSEWVAEKHRTWY